MSASSSAILARLATAAHGIPLLHAPPLEGITHAFTTRVGGVSPPPYDSLNLGRGTGDAPGNVEANRRRLLAFLGRDVRDHVEAAQVHGREVAVVDAAVRGAKVEGVDGLVTADPRVVLAMHAADCVPILLWDPRRGAVGAVHAGWRGTAAGVAAAAVEVMVRAFGTDPGHLRVALGPAIGPCHYEVGPEVARAFARWPWHEAVLRRGKGDRWFLDLAAANQHMLLNVGVPGAHICAADLCTVCHSDLFYSYRRDRVTGRMGALIALGR